MFLLQEEVSSVMLCSLHCEMRNTEHILGSIGLYAYKSGCLEQLNSKLREFSPETFSQPRITIKKYQNQETCIEKGNIKVASFSGENLS